jgi:hypothetical protein
VQRRSTVCVCVCIYIYSYINIYHRQNTAIKLSNDYHYTCFDPVMAIVRSLQRAENHLIYNKKYIYIVY